MGESKELNEIKRNSIITLYNEGYTERIVDEKLSVAKSTVHDIIASYRSYNKTAQYATNWKTESQ